MDVWKSVLRGGEDGRVEISEAEYKDQRPFSEDGSLLTWSSATAALSVIVRSDRVKTRFFHEKHSAGFGR
ncbi:hypothetical protein ACLOJK_005779 [Asimina triloba]